MANHGVVTAGPDLLTAFWSNGNGRAVLQKPPSSRKLLGTDAFSDSDVETLFEARARYGVTFPPGSHQARPITREAAESAQSCAEDFLRKRPVPLAGAKG